MKKEIYYICEFCNQKFNSEEECHEHEKTCGTDVKITLYMINNYIDNNCGESRIIRSVFENSRYTSDGYILINNNRTTLPKINIEKCDKIFFEDTQQCFFMYALNKDEKTCIEELVNKKKESMLNIIKTYEDEIKRLDDIDNTLKVEDYMNKFVGTEIFDNSLEL